MAACQPGPDAARHARVLALDDGSQAQRGSVARREAVYGDQGPSLVPSLQQLVGLLEGRSQGGDEALGDVPRVLLEHLGQGQLSVVDALDSIVAVVLLLGPDGRAHIADHVRGVVANRLAVDPGQTAELRGQDGGVAKRVARQPEVWEPATGPPADVSDAAKPADHQAVPQVVLEQVLDVAKVRLRVALLLFSFFE